MKRRVDNHQPPHKRLAKAKNSSGGEVSAPTENAGSIVDSLTPAAAIAEIIASVEQQSPCWINDVPAPESLKSDTKASDRFTLAPGLTTERPYRLRTIYIDGGQGVGKSHLLLEAVLILRKDPHFRVFYMPDWLDLVRAQEKSRLDAELLVKEYLADCLTEKDRKVEQIVSALDAVPFHLSDLLSAVTEHLKSIKCELILVFDKHNAIGSKHRQLWYNYPADIPLAGVAGAITIASASVNNEEPFKVHDSTEKVSFWDPFDDDEYRVWKERMASRIPDLDDDAARAITRNVPMFLTDLVKEINYRNCSFREGAEAYAENFILTSTKLYTEFINKRTSLREGYKEAAQLMEFAIATESPISGFCNPWLMDLRFCSRDYRRELIVAHHPLFRIMLARLRGYKGLDTEESLRKLQLSITVEEQSGHEVDARASSEETKSCPTKISIMEPPQQNADSEQDAPAREPPTRPTAVVSSLEAAVASGGAAIAAVSAVKATLDEVVPSTGQDTESTVKPSDAGDLKTVETETTTKTEEDAPAPVAVAPVEGTPAPTTVVEERATAPPASLAEQPSEVATNPVDAPPSLPPAPTQPDTNATAAASSSSVRPAAPTAAADGPAKEYSLKAIDWKLPGSADPVRKVNIIMQNENGPCPLLALCNVLLLRGDIKISVDRTTVTYEHLVHLIGDYLITRTQKPTPSTSPTAAPPPDSQSSLLLANLERNLQDAMDLIPTLQQGLDVNVRFDSPFSFELTPALLLFDLFGITLCHGWCVDPQDEETHRVVVGKMRSYNGVVEGVIAGEVSGTATPANEEEERKRETAVHDGLVCQAFLNSTASQLTYHGLNVLIDSLPPASLSVFFRNNHFCTLLRYPDNVPAPYSTVTLTTATAAPADTSASSQPTSFLSSIPLPNFPGLDRSRSRSRTATPAPPPAASLHTLVTDQGFLTTPGVVWETLANVEGDSTFADGLFRMFEGGDVEAAVAAAAAAAGDGDRLDPETERAIALLAVEDGGGGGGGVEGLEGVSIAEQERAWEQLRQQQRGRQSPPPPPAGAVGDSFDDDLALAISLSQQEAGGPPAPPPKTGGVPPRSSSYPVAQMRSDAEYARQLQRVEEERARAAGVDLRQQGRTGSARPAPQAAQSKKGDKEGCEVM
ncbi:Ubiquitin carboxyl-terminal hydrolase MINDY-1 [Phlyctochytrium bullatum]|nr:Ubiquitin carboxyl-terminal hydrolase MINDY-1 [Phlyctochytrium bullatum]